VTQGQPLARTATIAIGLFDAVVVISKILNGTITKIIEIMVRETNAVMGRRQKERDAVVERASGSSSAIGYVTGAEVARQIGVHDTTVYSWILGEFLPAVKMRCATRSGSCGGLYDRSGIPKWIANNSMQT
jgi:hypothetical protein